MSAFSLNSSRANSLSPFGRYLWQGQPRRKRSHESTTSLGTVDHAQEDVPSPHSAGSISSTRSHPLRVMNQNVSPTKSTSNITLPLSGIPGTSSPSTYGSKETVYTPYRGKYSQGNSSQGISSQLTENENFENVDLDTDTDERRSVQRNVAGSGKEPHRTVNPLPHSDTKSNLGVTVEEPLNANVREEAPPRPSITFTDTSPRSFKKLISAFSPNGSKPKRALKTRTERWSLDESEDDKSASLGLPNPRKIVGHKKASSWSSNGFISAVKSVAANIGPSSVAQDSQKGIRSNFLRRSDRSSTSSDFAYRISMDSSSGSSEFPDKAARDRAVQR